MQKLVLIFLEIIFGYSNQDHDVVLDCLNFCVLLAKYFIYRCKIDNRNIGLEQFKYELKNRLMCEKYILEVENKVGVFDKWHPVMNKLL